MNIHLQETQILMTKAIKKVEGILDDSTDSQALNAANCLSGLISRYVKLIETVELEKRIERLEKINNMLDLIPPEKWGKRRKIDLFVLRPSVDLGKLAGDFEPNLPPLFRYFMRGQGVKETASPDWLSMILFDKNYITALIRQGEKDAMAKIDELESFLTDTE